MKHKTITLISSALLDIEDLTFTSSFKHTYIAISFFRSSLSHIYYSRLYSEFRSPLTLFSLWTCPSESIPLPYPVSSLVVRPQGWAPLALACMSMLCEPD
jgi:hypothetical protein